MRLNARAALAALKLSLTLVLALQTGPAAATTVEQRLIAGLTAQGYVILEDGRTFLGRLRIVAEDGTYRREIVVNPETGEVLRDYAVLLWPDAPGKGQAPDLTGAAVASNGGGLNGGGSATTSSASTLIEGATTSATTAGSSTAGISTTGTSAGGTTAAGITSVLTGVQNGGKNGSQNGGTRSGSDATNEVLITDPAVTLGVTVP